MWLEYSTIRALALQIIAYTIAKATPETYSHARQVQHCWHMRSMNNACMTHATSQCQLRPVRHFAQHMPSVETVYSPDTQAEIKVVKAQRC
jgi:hypothetical protein